VTSTVLFEVLALGEGTGPSVFTFPPARIGIPGRSLGSAIPPGPGAHGMCGANAAQVAPQYLNRHQKR
jgi:hypothetical protein